MSLSLGLGLALTRNKGVGAAQYASHPAPAGYRWDFVTDNGVRVTDGNQPIVDLVRTA